MHNKQAIETKKAPLPLGNYSQAIRIENTVYLSGQIPLNSQGIFIEEDIEAQVRLIFENLKAVAEAAGGELNQCVKLTIFLTDLANFSIVNVVMADYFKSPYPARSTIEVSGLPKGAKVEIEGILVLDAHT
ncbi:MAG: Rid family detoxifying hydrolase [Rickettsiella sp.]|nr:Rid family detoxifying hydrolase [Rickettsiella sp.]